MTRIPEQCWWQSSCQRRKVWRSRHERGLQEGEGHLKVYDYFVRNETLVFVNFSAKDASKLKISVPIIKRRSWGFQNTPNLQILHDFKPSYGNLKEIKMSKNNFDWRFREGKSKPCFFGCAITRLKIMQTLQVGGVLESSGPPLDDGHRDF